MADAIHSSNRRYRRTDVEQKKNGVIAGTETISLSFVDGSGSFDILARFNGIPASTPGLYTLHEAGAIANGLGQCKGLSGSVTVHGPFMFPDPKLKGDTLWMAEIHGTALGVN